MEFSLLGPLEVRHRGDLVAIASEKQRMLLAALLIRRNNAVSAEELIDALWERPPRTAHASLLNHVGRLRRALPASALETVAPGYRLRTRPREVDVDRFLNLVQAGRDSEARERAELLREADSLWRGRAVADVMLFGSFAGEVDALDQLRLDTLEERVEADLAAGRHRELVAELEVLTAQHPLRERLLEQLMVALYRSGRQTDALDTYRRARRRLVEELGLDPGTALRRLERAILAHDLPLSARTRRDAPPSLLTKTVELAPGTYAEKAEFAYRLGIALGLMGEREHALEIFEEALDRAELAGARHIALRVQVELAVNRLRQKEATLAETLDFATRAAAEFDRHGDDLGEALALRTCGSLECGLGHVAQGGEHFRHAEKHGRRAVGASWPTGLILALEGESLFLGPMPVADAIKRCDEILDSVDWGPPGPLGVYGSLGMLYAMRGEVASGRIYVRRGAAACEEYGLAVLRAWFTLRAAGVEELAGDLGAAETVLRDAADDLENADEPMLASLVASAHARILALLGCGHAALERARLARPDLEDDAEAQIGWLRAAALARAVIGDDLVGAVSLGRRAVQAVSETDFLPIHAETELDLARVLAIAGRSDEALAAAATARLLFERKGHLSGIERADQFAPESVRLAAERR
jgi:DNA-binding SARP family transcriptional activator